MLPRGRGGVRRVAETFPSKVPQPSVSFTTSDSYRVHSRAGAGLTDSSYVEHAVGQGSRRL